MESASTKQIRAALHPAATSRDSFPIAGNQNMPPTGRLTRRRRPSRAEVAPDTRANTWGVPANAQIKRSCWTAPEARRGCRAPKGRTERERSMGKGYFLGRTNRVSPNQRVLMVALFLAASSFPAAARIRPSLVRLTNLRKPRKPHRSRRLINAQRMTTITTLPRSTEINRSRFPDRRRRIRTDYRIGPDDQLEISILEAAELDRNPRVSASGDISLD